jgi:hypothetical protein
MKMINFEILSFLFSNLSIKHFEYELKMLKLQKRSNLIQLQLNHSFLNISFSLNK